MGSLVIDADGGYIRRSANIPQYSAYSMCGWYKAASGVKAKGTAQSISGIGTSNTYGAIIRTDGGLGVKVYGGGTSGVVASGSWSEDAWIFITIATSDAPTQVLRFYNAAGGVLGTSSRADTNTPTWTVMEVGNEADGSPNFSAYGKYAYWKVWDAALSQSEFEAEMYEPVFVRTTNANTGFADSATDIGPNGRNWTHNFVGTDSDTPPVNLITPIVMTWTL